MYVNELTLDYGERGQAAVTRFLGEAASKDSSRRLMRWNL
jgi:predicted solute-binding protein